MRKRIVCDTDHFSTYHIPSNNGEIEKRIVEPHWGAHLIHNVHKNTTLVRVRAQTIQAVLLMFVIIATLAVFIFV